MKLLDIPATFWRGGTSNAVVFLASDLPIDKNQWDAIFLSVMGSPDPNKRQLDGMGGGISSLSKICILDKSSRPDADIDYTFAQISIDEAKVDYGGNCGNMSSAMGPAALDYGLVKPESPSTTKVRIHNTNTGKVIVSHFPIVDGKIATTGEMSIDGVAGYAAPIKLEFMEPGGAKTGHLLPTGNPVDQLALVDGSSINASLIDAANPCVFIDAAAIGKTGIESPDELSSDPAFLNRMEAIRCAGSVAMGLTIDLAAAQAMPSIPKVAMITASKDSITLEGKTIKGDQISLIIRMLSMEQPHKAVPITGSICLAVAARVRGTIPSLAAGKLKNAITIAHPSGTTVVDAKVAEEENQFKAESGSVYRTARKLFSGKVHYVG